MGSERAAERFIRLGGRSVSLIETACGLCSWRANNAPFNPRFQQRERKRSFSLTVPVTAGLHAELLWHRPWNPEPTGHESSNNVLTGVAMDFPYSTDLKPHT